MSPSSISNPTSPFSLLILLLLSSSTTTTTSSSLSSSKLALLSLRSAVGGRTLLWPTSSPTPCRWSGVQCHRNSVISLRLPAFSLAGKIPPGIFRNLTHLKTLSLRSNNLTGPIPSDLASCSQLTNLNLQHNHFQGHIPTSLALLNNLVRLSLAGNDLSGEIPRFVDGFKGLKSLYLEDNGFYGFLPQLKMGLEYLNVSHNGLSGSIPISLSHMPVTAFLGNRLCGQPLQICGPGFAAHGTGDFNNEHTKKGLSGGAIAGIVIGTVLAFAIILMVIVFMYSKNKSKKTNSVNLSSIDKQLGFNIPGENPFEEVENGGSSNGYSVSAAVAAMTTTNGNRKVGVANGGSASTKLVYFGNGVDGKMFGLEQLLRASAEVLGKGTFGTAYKAILETGTVVAVKRLRDVILSASEFEEKVEVVGAMDHENLVPLRAYYYGRDEKLLVYDYMPMGSLSAFLHGNTGAGRTPLNWEMRSSIALGIAHGINYLHCQGVSHGNIKSSNILLTKSYEPRVSDFALAHLVGPPSTPTQANGYRAPEVIDPQTVSQKADVYSFGVLIMELLTGKAPAHTLLNEEGIDLPKWVDSVTKDEWTTEVLDLELLRYQQQAEEEMVELLQLAVDCAAQFPDSRPSMTQVTTCIEELLCHSRVDDESSQ